MVELEKDRDKKEEERERIKKEKEIEIQSFYKNAKKYMYLLSKVFVLINNKKR